MKLKINPALVISVWSIIGVIFSFLPSKVLGIGFAIVSVSLIALVLIILFVENFAKLRNNQGGGGSIYVPVDPSVPEHDEKWFSIPGPNPKGLDLPLNQKPL